MVRATAALCTANNCDDLLRFCSEVKITFGTGWQDRDWRQNLLGAGNKVMSKLVSLNSASRAVSCVLMSVSCAIVEG